MAHFIFEGNTDDMTASTAEDLYEIAKGLPASERLRLVEKIAHDLTVQVDAGAATAHEVARPEERPRGRTQIVGQVTDIAFEPLRFTIRTSQRAVSVRAGAALLDTLRSAWGQEVIADVDAVLDQDGTAQDAEVVALEIAAQPEDLLSNFEATFGSGSEVWSGSEAQGYLEAMRGGRS